MYHFRKIFLFGAGFLFACMAFTDVITHTDSVIARSERNVPLSWVIESSAGFMLSYPDSKLKDETITCPKLTITETKGKFYCNGKKIAADRIILTPIPGELVFQDKSYSGALTLERQKKRMVISHVSTINTLATSVDVPINSPAVAKPAQTLSGAIKTSKERSKDFTVRVMLAERELMYNDPWKLKSSKGFLLADPRDPSTKKMVQAEEIAITVKKGAVICINGEAMFTQQVYVKPVADTISFEGLDYQGAFWLLVDGGSIKLINCIGLEEYVASVLCTESWPGWSLEVNKVFAIACRTYVIAMVQQARKSKRAYHVKNTNIHQTYTGGCAAPVLRQAVEQTKGVFLTHNNKPITAMFDGCCGGVIPAHIQGMNFSSAPYLARTYPCTYCKDYAVYTWEACYDIHELEKLLKPELPHLHRLRDVKVVKKDKAGIALEVSVKSAGHGHTLTGKKVYSLLNKQVKSFCYNVHKEGHNIIFKGRGRGHHMGLCQWGAKEMISQGWDFKSTLEFYYPGTKLMRLI